MITLIERLNNFKGNSAIIDKRGEYSYQELLDSSSYVAFSLLRGKDSLNETRVAFIVPLKL